MHEPTDNKGSLRQRAEQHLHDEPESPDTLSREEAQRLLHELRVHQIELDMQNVELRQAQEELIVARDRYRDLYEFAPVGYLTLDAQGRILQINLTGAGLLGIEGHHLLRKAFSRFVAREAQDDYHFFLQRLHEDSQAMVELLLNKAKGAPFWARLDAVRDTRTNGARETPAFRVTISDITTRKQAEEANARQTAELAATMASLADGLVVFNPAGDIIRMNDAAAHLLGYSPDEPTMPFTARMYALHVQALDGSLYPPDETPTGRALRGDTTKGAVMVLHHPDHTVWVLASAAPIRMPDGRFLGAVTTFSDITPLHDLQEQQILLHLVSHDLRSPLSVIYGHAQLIQDRITELGVDGVITDSLYAMRRGVKRMTAMIDDLTELARIEGGQLQLKRVPVEMAAYLQDFLQRSATVLDLPRIHLDLAPEVPPVPADYDRLDRIFSNLLSNALKYSDPGTPVQVRVCQQDGEVVVSITDHGHGIPPDDVSHLFQRFYRVIGEQRAEGIGLGLYITKVLVEAHDGHIWVESEVGIGSTFYFTLPLAAKATP